MKSIEKAQSANKILVTERNKQVSTDWLYDNADIEVPEMFGRCLHPGE
jgi:hypothetical protein